MATEGIDCSLTRMAVTGLYLALQIEGRIIGPVLAFSECIFRDVLPPFANLDKRALQLAEEYYNRIGSQPAGEYQEVDMADVAEAAHDHSLAWYQTMVAVRQAMLNLLAAGLFHLAEQQLGDSCRDASFHIDPPGDTKLGVLADWYFDHFGLDLKALPSWSAFDELRLVANAVKHAEGSATKQLRAVRPELFSNPDFAAIYKEFAEAGISPAIGPVLAPLSGEGLFVSEKLLKMYVDGAESFFNEIAAHFKSKAEAFYPF
jgi:hypothetical protein